MSSIVAAANALVDQVNDALEAAELKARATTDPAKARTHALAKCGVQLGPPTYEFGGVLEGGADITWTFTVAARPQPTVMDAWAAIDQVIEVIQSVVDLATARPGAMNSPEGGEPIPAYVLTTHPTTL